MGSYRALVDQFKGTCSQAQASKWIIESRLYGLDETAPITEMAPTPVTEMNTGAPKRTPYLCRRHALQRSIEMAQEISNCT